MNQQNSSKLIKIITLLVCASGVAWFGFGLLNKYQQVQQLKQADKLLETKEYSLAIEAYDLLLTRNIGKDHLIWINRGYGFLGLNQYQEMLQSCSTATLIKPDAALGWNCQGEAFYYLKQNQKALNAFEEANQKKPLEPTFWLNKARVLSELQQYDKAIAASEQAIKLIDISNSPQSTDSLAIAHNQKGQNLLKIKKYKQSLQAFEQSLQNSPNYLSAHQGKGIALYELGNYQQAIIVFEEILKRNSLSNEQKAISLLYTGVSLCQTQKSVAARAAFKKSLLLSQDEKLQEIAKKGCGIQ